MDKNKVARSFFKGRNTYDDHARMQRRVSEELIDTLKRYDKINYRRVLEIGCCTGTLTEMLVRSARVGKLYLNDLVPQFYETVQDRLHATPAVDADPLFGDIEELQLPTDLDLVISSSTFQWLSDLSALFEKTAHSLVDGGFLAFSMFSSGTLHEFRKITGIGLEYLNTGSISAMLEEKFVLEETKEISDVLYFTTPREVLRHLQSTGVGGVVDYRWSRRGLLEFERRYAEEYGTDTGIPVTYVSTSVIASKKRRGIWRPVELSASPV